MRTSILLYLIVAAISFTHCDARRSSRRILDKAPITHQKSLFLLTAAKLNLVNYLNFDSSNSGSYSLSSPNSMPPYDSLAPIPLPENAPPYCSYPPNTPQSPSTAFPSPTGYTPSTPPSPFNLPPDLPIQNPPPGLTPTPSGGLPSPVGLTPTPSGGLPSPGFSPNPTSPVIVPNPPEVVPSPTTTIPSPYGPILSPPYFEPTPSEPSLSPPYFEPSPPGLVPNPPTSFPSPYGFNPSPPVFLPPIVFPPPTGPPPKRSGPALAAWCVAKPSVPDPIIQEAMNYACGSGADCDSILPSGSCFEPDTLLAHASYAFNSYWQRSKVAGGNCEFGGTAMLVTVDPSYDGCHFVHY
ncbi:hypothetical protein UlMin_025329 [Ulmus minor]